VSYDPDRDAYFILGVDPEASQKEVEAAFRKAALTWHPDKSPAPDAADKFHDVEAAGNILRDPRRRRLYDLMRQRHVGRTIRRTQPKPPEPHAPMRPPPSWLMGKVRVHMDAVLFSIEQPKVPARRSALFTLIAFVTFILALVEGQILVGFLALVIWVLGRVFAAPPHEGQLAWAKIAPGRRVAEYHALDQRRSRYQRLTVPFHRLSLALIQTPYDYRVEIHGFPHDATPILVRTRNLDEARRCAQEAGKWLSLPIARAA
jgi:hypothetical protein